MKTISNMFKTILAVVAQHALYVLVFLMLCVSFAALLMPETKRSSPF